MTPPAQEAGSSRFGAIVVLLARFTLAAVFIYMGLNKALHPVEFLKLVRQYDAIHAPFLLNLTASTLPWMEVFCGVMLLAGIAVRGTAVVLVAMLIPFTILVLLRAMAISKAGGLALCDVRFDCGCGAGEVWICGKLAENVVLTAFSGTLILLRRGQFCLRHTWQGR